MLLPILAELRFLWFRKTYTSEFTYWW